MSKLFFILIISIIFSNCSKIKKYNTDWNSYTVKGAKKSACVCFDLQDRFLWGSKTFYLTGESGDKNARIDKTLYYNFMNSCDSQKTCDDIYSGNYSKNIDLTTDIEGILGFHLEYRFNIPDESKKALLIQYKNFTGEELTFLYTFAKEKSAMAIVLMILAFSITIINPFLIISTRKSLKDKNIMKE